MSKSPQLKEKIEGLVNKLKENKEFIKKIGTIISVLAIGYVFLFLYKLIHDELHDFDISKLLGPFIIFTIIAVVCIFLNSYNYYIILKVILKIDLHYKSVRNIYVKSNICKYLPSNVMHYVGRNVLAVKYSISQKKMVLSSVIEIINTVFGTVYFCILLYMFEKRYYLIMIIFSLIVFYLLKKKNFHKSFMIVVLCTFIENMIFVMLMNLYRNTSIMLDYSEISIYQSISWLIGFMTPGSPGGMGIKEFILIKLTPEKFIMQLPIIAVMQRIILVLGDIMSFFIIKINEYLIQNKN